MLNKKFYETCKEYLKREEIKQELVSIVKPFLGAFLSEMYPYILFLVVIILFTFLLILSVLYNLLRLKNILLGEKTTDHFDGSAKNQYFVI